jgi:hypothetical protein
MKVTKKAPEGAMGSVNPPYSPSAMVAAKSLDAENAKPRFSADEKTRQSPASDRPLSRGKSDEVAKKAKKKAGSVDDKWPFASITPQDLENEIRERAFYIYLQRGTEGDPMSDWLQAEAEIKRKYGIGT